MSNTIREAEPGTSASKVTPLPARAAANTPYRWTIALRAIPA